MLTVRPQLVYTYDELSDEAKARARDWWREASAGDNWFSEAVIEDAATIAPMLGVDLHYRTARLYGGGTRQKPAIYWAGFYSQGDGACFEGSFDGDKVNPTGLREHAPQDSELQRIADGLAQARGMTATIRHTGHYSHEHSVTFDWDYDESKAGATEEDIEDLLRDFMRWIYRALEREYEYVMGNECVAETIEANEYEFDESGRLL